MAAEQLLGEEQGSSTTPSNKRPDQPRDEAQVDNAVDGSFPANDPPAWASQAGRQTPARPRGPSRASDPGRRKLYGQLCLAQGSHVPGAADRGRGALRLLPRSSRCLQPRHNHARHGRKPPSPPPRQPWTITPMPTIKLHYDGWLALPAALRQALGMNSGDRLVAELVDARSCCAPLPRLGVRRRPEKQRLPSVPMPQERCRSQPMLPRPAASPDGRGRSPPSRTSRSPRRRRRAAARARRRLPATAMRPHPEGPSWDLRSC